MYTQVLDFSYNISLLDLLEIAGIIMMTDDGSSPFSFVSKQIIVLKFSLSLRKYSVNQNYYV